jgi:hypothetical protein
MERGWRERQWSRLYPESVSTMMLAVQGYSVRPEEGSTRKKESEKLR